MIHPPLHPLPPLDSVELFKKVGEADRIKGGERKRTPSPRAGEGWGEGDVNFFIAPTIVRKIELITQRVLFLFLEVPRP